MKIQILQGVTMGTKTENVDINTSMYEELIEKLATVEDSEEQARLVTEYYTKIFTVRS